MGKGDLLKLLKDYQDKVNNWLEFKKDKEGTEFNKEINTVIKFVVPLLNLLGWDSLSEEVEFEYLDSAGGRADIALYINNVPKILIEVKPIQNPFKDKYPTKIFNYISKARIKYGIATNGKEIILYDNYRVRKEYKRGSKLFSLKLDDFIEYSNVLLLLSKDMVEKGVLDKFATTFHRDNNNFYKWRKSKMKAGDSNYNEYILRLEFAKEFLK